MGQFDVIQEKYVRHTARGFVVVPFFLILTGGAIFIFLSFNLIGILLYSLCTVGFLIYFEVLNVYYYGKMSKYDFKKSIVLFFQVVPWIGLILTTVHFCGLLLLSTAYEVNLEFILPSLIVFVGHFIILIILPIWIKSRNLRKGVSNHGV